MSNDVCKNKGAINIEKEEIDENGHIIDKKKQSTINFIKSHQLQQNRNNYGNTTSFKF